MKKIKFNNLFDDIKISQDTLIKLALETGLINRKRLISAHDLLYSICMESTNGSVSYNDIASHLESESEVSVSRQAIWKKINEPCYDFFQRVLELVILSKMDKTQVKAIGKLCQFKRILVQDSTIIKLPVKLFKDFSGVANQNTKTCNARIQGVYDILNECFVAFSIDSYSKNDLEAAPDLDLKQGDLTLRDRGYLLYDEISRHIDSGADCIYRYKNKMKLLDPLTEQPIDILEKLKKQNFIDTEVKLNNKDKTLLRITASPVDEKIANARRMKAKQEKKTPPSKEYLQLLSWSIFITTIPAKKVEYQTLLKIYGLRWRIEIIFKSWKSNMAFDKIHEVSKIQLNVILLARFIMILICSQYIFVPCKQLIKRMLQKNLSLLKVIHYLTRNQDKIIEILMDLAQNPKKPRKTIITLAKYCSYDTRKRLNFEQDLENIFSLS